MEDEKEEEDVCIHNKKKCSLVDTIYNSRKEYEQMSPTNEFSYKSFIQTFNKTQF